MIGTIGDRDSDNPVQSEQLHDDSNDDGNFGWREN